MHACNCAEPNLSMHGDDQKGSHGPQSAELVQSDEPYPAELPTVLQAMTRDLSAIDDATLGARGSEQAGILTRGIQSDYKRTQQMLNDFNQFLAGLTPGGARLTTIQIVQIKTQVEGNPLLALRAFEELRNTAKVNIQGLNPEGIRSAYRIVSMATSRLSSSSDRAQNVDNFLVSLLRQANTINSTRAVGFDVGFNAVPNTLRTIQEFTRKHPDAAQSIVRELQSRAEQLTTSLQNLTRPSAGNFSRAFVGAPLSSKLIHNYNEQLGCISIVADILAAYPMQGSSQKLIEAVLNSEHPRTRSKVSVVTTLGHNLALETDSKRATAVVNLLMGCAKDERREKEVADAAAEALEQAGASNQDQAICHIIKQATRAALASARQAWEKAKEEKGKRGKDLATAELKKIASDINARSEAVEKYIGSCQSMEDLLKLVDDQFKDILHEDLLESSPGIILRKVETLRLISVDDAKRELLKPEKIKPMRLAVYAGILVSALASQDEARASAALEALEEIVKKAKQNKESTKLETLSKITQHNLDNFRALQKTLKSGGGYKEVIKTHLAKIVAEVHEKIEVVSGRIQHCKDTESLLKAIDGFEKVLNRKVISDLKGKIVPQPTSGGCTIS